MRKTMSRALKWVCPKCAGSECIYIPGYKGGRGGVPVTAFLTSALQPSRYICGQCGFVEEYFDNRDHLEAVRRKHEGSSSRD